MASEVDICNLALAHLGDDATVSSINPPEGSSQAEHCKRFYPIARDACLERYAWKFATRRVQLAQLADTPPASWLFAYAWPNNGLVIRAVYPIGAGDDDNDGEEFIVETAADGSQVIYSNAQIATALVTLRVTDTTKFSPLFVNATSRLLASYLAGPVLKTDVGRDEAKNQYNWFLQELNTATTSDARSRKKETYKNYQPSNIRARM